MADIKLNPYLSSDGHARDMLEFYHKVLGGELNLQTYGESPVEAPESHKDMIMHGALESGGITVMAADAPPGMELSNKNSLVSLSLTGKDEAKLRKIFEGLSDGGKVTMPLEKQFWGDIFGMADDKFGIHWLVNIDSGQQGKA